jgi:hypothetical protein
MCKIRGIVKLLHLLVVAVLQHVCLLKIVFLTVLVECERLLAEEEDAQSPKVEIIRQPNGDAYTSNPML